MSNVGVERRHAVTDLITLRRATIVLLATEVAVTVLVLISGHMHAGSQPTWVDATGQVGAACFLGLGVVAAVGARRRTPQPSLGRLGLAFGALTLFPTMAVSSVLQPGTPAPLWTYPLVAVAAISFGGLATVAAYAFLPRVRLW